MEINIKINEDNPIDSFNSLLNKLDNIIDDKRDDIDSMVVGVTTGIFIQGSPNFNQVPDSNLTYGDSDIYNIGKYNNLDVFMDTKITLNDKFIYFKKGDDIIIKLNIIDSKWFMI
jgi:hypothetical protein